jgi:acyl-CoA reductase-like NAD-dependent aldehyde dehydrogenase
MIVDANDTVRTHVAGRRFAMLIGAELLDGAATRAVVDPSTGDAVAAVPEASAAEVDRAVAAARAAQPAWARLELRERIAQLERFADALRAHSDELAFIESIDTGNPLPSTRRDISIALAHLRDWPAFATTLAGRVLPVDGPVLSFVSYMPYGVVGRITAFNHPLLFAVNAAMLALLAGNSVVIKSSELAPLSTLAVGELFAETLPPGAVNIVSGGAVAGAAIVSHPAVRRVSFVGSVSTGLRVQELAARSGTVKHVSLELGGKNAMIVMPDADVDRAVEAAMLGMSLEVSQGQSCQATSRLLVHRSIADEFVERAGARLREYRIGPAYDERSQVGPLVSAAQLEMVRGYVDAGIADGARLVAGGNRPADVPPGGFYIEPVLFTGVAPEMRIAREEVFGPLMCVMPWDDYDRMLEMANGIELGLSASVWSENVHLALETARRVEAGYVWVNDTNRHYLGAPYGGMKNSGVGREESVEELLSYLEVKSTHVRMDDPVPALDRVRSRRVDISSGRL